MRQHRTTGRIGVPPPVQCSSIPRLKPTQRAVSYCVQTGASTGLIVQQLFLLGQPGCLPNRARTVYHLLMPRSTLPNKRCRGPKAHMKPWPGHGTTVAGGLAHTALGHHEAVLHPPHSCYFRALCHQGSGTSVLPQIHPSGVQTPL